MQAEELLTIIQGIMAEEHQWRSQVRFNWLREFGKNLVLLMNPEYSVEFMKLAEPEFRLPKGIIAIHQVLDDKYMLSFNKIAEIKAVLTAKGYDGVNQHQSWKRTDVTHGVYCRLAQAIHEYERQSNPMPTDYRRTVACS